MFHSGYKSNQNEFATTSVQLVSEDLSACRICLATNTKLYSISDGLEECFIQLMDVDYSDDDGLPQHLCSFCRMQLLRFADLRARCHRAQALLGQLLSQRFISTDDILSLKIDNYKLALNLAQANVYTFNSSDNTSNNNCNNKQEEACNNKPEEACNNKQEEACNNKQGEACNNKQEEAFDDSFDDTEITEAKDELPDPLMEQTATIDEISANIEEPKKRLVVEIDGLNLGRISVRNLEITKDPDSLEVTEAELKNLEVAKDKLKSLRVVQDSPKKQKEDKEKTLRVSNLLRYVAGKKRKAEPLTKWQQQLRRAENNFLPNFDHAEFESKHNCKIKILTMEEQLHEIEERKGSSNYLNLDYKCEHCGRGFEFEQPFKNHMSKHDPSIGNFECEVCHVYFRTQYLRHRHLDTHKMKFTCNLCGFVTRAKHLARNHFLMHTGKVYKCKLCDASFTKSTSYYGHVRLNHPSKEHVCGTCGDSFIGPRGLRHHQVKAHRELSKSKLKCKACGVMFTSSEARSAHKNGQKKCDGTLKACSECGSVFGTADELKTHADTHNVFRCEECSQSFVSQNSLDTHHQRVHLRIKWAAYGRTREMNKEYYRKIKERTRFRAQVVCEICGAKLVSNTALVRHQRGQCKREKYKCQICDKPCSTRQGLKLHVTLHTGEKPYKCLHCEQEFRQSGTLRRHTEAVHLGIDTRVQCTHCDKYFSTRASRKLHVSTVHLQLPRRRGGGGGGGGADT